MKASVGTGKQKRKRIPIKNLFAGSGTFLHNESMKNKNTIKSDQINDNTLVQVLNCDDYYGDSKPSTGKPITFKQFKKENVWEDDEFSLSNWYEASGDGDENHVLLTIINGVICTVLP